jgi:hypothetical protein
MFFLLSQPQPPTVVRKPSITVVDNGKVRLTIDTATGTYGVAWDKGDSLTKIQGQVRLADNTYRGTSSYDRHVVGKLDVQPVHDRLGDGIQITEHHLKAGWPELRNLFWIYKDKPEIIVRLDLVGSGSSVSTRSLVPVVSDSQIAIKHSGTLQSLFVPYDNDNYFRYRSDGWGEGPGDGDGSYELGAIYDNLGNQALVVGSIDHDEWKTAIRFRRDAKGDAVGVRVVAGVATKYTHDTGLPSLITGKVIQSPRIVLGGYGDWSKGLERFGDLNAIVKPPLPWSGEIPFGWSSWSGHKDHVNALDAKVATDFLNTKLPWFRSGGTAFVNLDSYWDNLKTSELVEFSRHAHACGLKAGIYYTPFTGWGKLPDGVRGTPYKIQDLVIKQEDGTPLPALDGGWPLDPTHAGTLQRIDQQLDQFLKWGFDYVKLDFMTHAALEGKHFDPKIVTGTQAYNFGLKHIADYLSPKKVGRPIFIGLSIAPLFPNGYAHARRVSCDVFANIGATEYLLNSATYGWWTNHRLYRYNDPDSSCVYQPLGEPPVTEAESRSRFTASIISGGMMLAGDDFTKPEACERVLSIFSHRDLLDIARKAPAFQTMVNDTGSKASDAFEWQDGNTSYIAVFNYGKVAADRSVSLTGVLPKGKTLTMEDLWTGKTYSADSSNVLKVSLAPFDCMFFKISRQ